MFLHPRIGNIWLTDIGAFGDVTYSENWLHGPEQAKWGMRAGTRHHALTPGAPTALYAGCMPVWWGYLAEPGRDGTFEAIGSWKLGEGVQAIDGASAPTNVPQDAAAAAITRLAVPWGQPSPISTTPIGEDPDPTKYLTALLDDMSETTGGRWRVDHNGNLVVVPPPTSPSWGLVVRDDLWSTATDDYVTHLNVDYLGAGPAFATFTYTTPESELAADRFGRREQQLDLTGYGLIDLPTATGYAAAVLEKTGPRQVLTEPLQLVPGQLRTLGDTPAGWNDVHAGQSFRCWGLVDRDRVQPTATTDVTIGRLERTNTTLTLTPESAPPTNTRDVIAAIAAAA